MNKNKTMAKVLTTSTADVYVVPAAFKSEVDSIVITNGSNAHVDVTLQWYEASTATTYDIADAVRMTPHSMLQLTDAFFFDKNDKVVGSASVSDVVTVNVRSREYFAERL
jgi:hypothetical protein